MYNEDNIEIPDIDLNTQPSINLIKQSQNLPELDEEVVPSVYASHWPDGFKGRDLRPRLTDSSKVTYLMDSGSMVCVWPASLELRPPPAA